METSQIVLNQGLTFLAIATGIILLIVGGFLTKLLIDLSKLTKNLDETTSVVKSEIEPTLQELNKALKSINSIAENADKQVGSLGKLLEDTIGAGSIIFSKARDLSGGLVKTIAKSVVTLIKLFFKK